MRISNFHLVLTFILAALVSQAGAQTPSFLLTPTYPGGSYGIAVADFNGDGNPDIAAIDSNGSMTTLLFGNGDGTFRTGPTFAIGGNIILTADFNGDGKPDLLLASANASDTDSTIAVLLGNGDGTFQHVVLTGAGTLLSKAFAADVNGDGKPDLVAVDPRSTGLFVFLGNGDGSFTAISPDFAIQTQTMVSGDFNGDGRIDIALAETNGIGVALGNGDGTFQTPILTTGVSGTVALAAGDFTGDGKLDLVAVESQSSAQSFLVCLGNGNGTFSLGQPVELVGTDPYSVVASADFNGDSKLDIVIADEFSTDNSGFTRVFLGKGDGTFTEVGDYVASGTSIAIADFNNDHKPDIATAAVNVLIGNGDGTFKGQPAIQTGDTTGYGTAVAADFNADGKPDLAVVGANVSILLNEGAGLNSVTHSYPLPTGDVGSSIVAADVNGDGKLDLLTGVTDPGGNSSSLVVMLGNGDGTFRAPSSVSLGIGQTPILAVGDFNGDQKVDVAAVFSGDFSGSNGFTGRSSMVVLLGKGDGTFAIPTSYYAGLGETWLAVSDFNEDGKLDVAVAGSAGIAILLGKGDGTFESPTFVASNSFSFVGTADLNGDGKLDLTTLSPVQNGISGYFVLQAFLGNGDGTFQTLPEFGRLDHDAIGNTSLVAAHLTGDGKLDLIGGNVGVSDTGIAVFPGNGDGTFGSAAKFSFPAASGSIYLSPIAADFNSDGKPDIVAVSGFGWLGLFYNTTQPDFTISATALSPSMVTPGNSATSTVTVAALNGFNSAVSLSCSGLPTGANCSFNPASVPNGSGTSALSITTSAATPVGTYPVSVNGTSGALKHSASLSLVVQQAAGFTISATALSPAPISAGGSATSTITVAGTGGFNQGVTLSCSSITLNGAAATTAPPTCSFNPSSVVSGSGTSMFTVSTTAGSALRAPPSMRRTGLFYAMGLPMLGMALMGAGLRPRKKNFLGFVLVCLMISGLIFLTACGGGSGGGGGGGSGGTPAGTYTIKVSGTAGSTVNSATVAVTVQ
jgi:hypothetical protein